MTNARYLGYFEPASDEWLDNRKFRLGGSEIAAVMGLSPWHSHLTLWLIKKGFAAARTDRFGVIAGSAEREWGNRLESAIIAKFFETEGRYRWDGDNPGSWVHPDRQWQMASPDDFVCDEHPFSERTAIFEAKTASQPYEWGEQYTDEIPVYYRCQLLWYLDVFGYSRAYLSVLIQGHDYREYELDSTTEDAQNDLKIMRAAGEAFVTSLINDKRPEIDGHDQTLRVIREMNPDIDPTLECEIDDLKKDSFLEAVRLFNQAKEAKQATAAAILDVMGKARDAVDLQGKRFAFRVPTQGDGNAPHLRALPSLIKERPHTIAQAVEMRRSHASADSQ